MATFDAAPLVSLLTDEPGAGAVVDYLTSSDTNGICSINYAEVVDRVARGARSGPTEIADWFSTWNDFGLEVIALSSVLATAAATLRVEHYHSRRTPISLADCCAIALAQQRGDPLATSYGPMMRVARAIGVEVIALPDSSGRVPD